MSEKTTSSSMCARAYDYFFPSLAEVGDTNLKIQRRAVQVLIRTSQLTCVVSSAMLPFQYQQKKALSDAGSTNMSAVAVTSVFCCFLLTQYRERIDEMLNVPNLTFEKIYEKNLLHRLSPEILQQKFRKMIGKYLGQSFIQLTKDFDLCRLVASEAIPLECCRFENYGAKLEKLQPNDIAAAFPLRIEAWAQPIPEKLQPEAQRQQKEYEAIQKISDRFPDRSVNLASVFLTHADNSGNFGEAVNLAHAQQMEYEKAVAVYVAKSQIFKALLQSVPSSC